MMSGAEEYLSIQELAIQCSTQFPGADQKTRNWWERLAAPGPGPRRRKELNQVAEELDVVYEPAD